MDVEQLRDALGKIGAFIGLLFLGAALLAAVTAGVVIVIVPIFLL